MRLRIVLILLLAAPIAAQNIRSAVSITGLDTNPCTVPLPCRTFNHALSTTNSGGEVIALTSGGYGTMSIDRAVTVRPVPGAYAGISPSGTSSYGIYIFAPTDADIILRGITINGLNASWGVYFAQGGSLHIQDCSFDRLTAGAIFNAGAGPMMVSDTTITNVHNGLELGRGDNRFRATIVNCRIDSADNVGIFAYQYVDATIIDTVIANSNTGIHALSQLPGTFASVVVEKCVITGNSAGISAAISPGGGFVDVRVSNSTIVNNNVGVSPGAPLSAPIFTRENNTLADNTSNGSFTASFPAQ